MEHAAGHSLFEQIEISNSKKFRACLPPLLPGSVQPHERGEVDRTAASVGIAPLLGCEKGALTMHCVAGAVKKEMEIDVGDARPFFEHF